jgi:hypothetical protein
MSRLTAAEAQNTLRLKGYRIRELVFIPRGMGAEEGWQMVVTGPNGDEFLHALGGVACCAEALLHAAVAMPPCGEFMAAQEREQRRLA